MCKKLTEFDYNLVDLEMKKIGSFVAGGFRFFVDDTMPAGLIK